MAKFKKGQKRPANAGRRRGSQNLTTRLLKDAAILAAAQLGDLSGIADLSKEGAEHGTDGLVGFLRWAGKMHTPAFLTLLGRAMPMQVNVSDESSGRRGYRTLEEIERDIAARGFSTSEFGHLLIEATAVEVKTVVPVDKDNEETDKAEAPHGGKQD